MEGKYESVITEIDKLPRKKTNKKINEEYETIKKEIDELLENLDKESN
jgi:hypothetical protein